MTLPLLHILMSNVLTLSWMLQMMFQPRKIQVFVEVAFVHFNWSPVPVICGIEKSEEGSPRMQLNKTCCNPNLNITLSMNSCVWRTTDGFFKISNSFIAHSPPQPVTKRDTYQRFSYQNMNTWQSVDHCCSQVNKREWRQILNSEKVISEPFPKVLLCTCKIFCFVLIEIPQTPEDVWGDTVLSNNIAGIFINSWYRLQHHYSHVKGEWRWHQCWHCSVTIHFLIFYFSE